MRERLAADLTDALRAKDLRRVKVLRAALAAIANAEAVDASTVARGVTEVARRELTDDDVRAVLVAEHDELVAAVADLRAHDRDTTDLDARIEILSAYL